MESVNTNLISYELKQHNLHGTSVKFCVKGFHSFLECVCGCQLFTMPTLFTPRSRNLPIMFQCSRFSCLFVWRKILSIGIEIWQYPVNHCTTTRDYHFFAFVNHSRPTLLCLSIQLISIYIYWKTYKFVRCKTLIHFVISYLVATTTRAFHERHTANSVQKSQR